MLLQLIFFLLPLFVSVLLLSSFAQPFFVLQLIQPFFVLRLILQQELQLRRLLQQLLRFKPIFLLQPFLPLNELLQLI